MLDFQKVKLKNFQTVITSSNNETRTVVIIGESIEAATDQVGKFCKHLSETGGAEFTASHLVELSHYHVTYTESAWKTLKQI
jgi:hypothetical protein